MYFEALHLTYKNTNDEKVLGVDDLRCYLDGFIPAGRLCFKAFTRRFGAGSGMVRSLLDMLDCWIDLSLAKGSKPVEK